MKREELKALGLSDEQIDQVMSLNGTDINREKQNAQALQTRVEELQAEATATAQRYATYDSDMAELATLRAEKTERGFMDRFSTVLGDRKPKNTYTRDGLLADFRQAVENPDNAQRSDDELLAEIIGDKEADYFESRVTVDMTPTHDTPDVDPVRAIQDAKYGSNPFYKK